MSHPTSSTSRKSSRSAPATQTTQVSQGNKAKGKDKKKPGRIKGREIQKLSINEVPVEVLLNIFSKLSPKTISTVVKLVCRGWKDLGSDVFLWKAVAERVSVKVSTTSTGEATLDQEAQDFEKGKKILGILDAGELRQEPYYETSIYKSYSGRLYVQAQVISAGRIARLERRISSISSIEIAVRQTLTQRQQAQDGADFRLGRDNYLALVCQVLPGVSDLGAKEIVVRDLGSDLGKQIRLKRLEEEQDYQLSIQIISDFLGQYNKNTDGDTDTNIRVFCKEKLDEAFYGQLSCAYREDLVIICKDFIKSESKEPFRDYMQNWSAPSQSQNRLKNCREFFILIGKFKREDLEQEERDYTLGLKTEVAKLEREKSQKKFQLPPEYTSKYNDPSIALYVIATYSREELISIGIKARENEGSSSSAGVIKPQSVEPKKKDNEAAIDKAQKEAYDAGLNDLIEHYKEIFPTTNIEAIEQQVLKENTPAEIASWGAEEVLGKNKPKTTKVPIKKPTEKKAIAKEVKRIDKKYKDDEYTYGTKKRGKKKVVESSSSSSSDSDSPKLKRKNRKKK